MKAATLATKKRTYALVEVFFSLQGEGARAGSANVFVRFAGCDLQCSKEREGFNCDTDFAKARAGHVDAVGLAALVRATDESRCGWVILTGGEPSLQFDGDLRDALHAAGFRIAVETNGKRSLRASPDYVAVSPKRGNPCLLAHANECRIVLGAGQNPDAAQLEMASRANEVFVSPAFTAPRVGEFEGYVPSLYDMDRAAVEWCVDFVKRHPRYRLSLQTHKITGIP